LATVTRVIAADPISTALLVASWEGVAPRRGRASFAVRLDVAGRPARLTLAALSDDDATGTGATLAILTVAGPRPTAAAFLASLADAAEARADAA